MNPGLEQPRGGRLGRWRLIVLTQVWAVLTCAGVPQPMCIFYGQAVDGFGLPYTTNATVILRQGTHEIARHAIGGALAPGVNFALYAHLDEGRTATHYSARAVRSGEMVTVTVRDLEGEKTIMERPVPPIGPAGSQVLIHVTAAEDTDGDGLPDPWEEELIAWSGGGLSDLDEVRGGDDFDGDGQTNGEEYQAGTFAFLMNDYFFAEQTKLTPHGNLQLTFWGVPGKTYRAEGVTNLALPAWVSCPVALSDAGALETTPAVGTGDWLSVYLPVDSTFRLFRLVVK